MTTVLPTVSPSSPSIVPSDLELSESATQIIMWVKYNTAYLSVNWRMLVSKGVSGHKILESNLQPKWTSVNGPQNGMKSLTRNILIPRSASKQRISKICNCATNVRYWFCIQLGFVGTWGLNESIRFMTNSLSDRIWHYLVFIAYCRPIYYKINFYCMRTWAHIRNNNFKRGKIHMTSWMVQSLWDLSKEIL